MTTRHPFALDRFQLDAIAELERGHSVLVAAPTGAGKTVVAEAAIDMALEGGGKAFYTTPIKALSNQKFVDLGRRLGTERVGLLTGDSVQNPDAPVVVMTTEVLRNMIYAGSPALEGLEVVILDEVHYLQDAYRGPVWEEVIIHLPGEVRLVCLSATVSNAGELGEWIGAVRGPTGTVVETRRPVDLEALYLVGDRSAERYHLVPVLLDGSPNPIGAGFTRDPRLARRGHRGRPTRRYFSPRRVETVERLAEEDLLPAIYFIFSRAACDDAVRACRDIGLRLTTIGERARIRAIVEDRLGSLNDDDLDALDFDLWAESIEAGVAAHHAGLLPAFKEVVEACFTEGLVKVVFATETLALGINMPARSVVIEKLSKFNGERHEFLTPGEFTQLTGRAGRRGLDEVGYAVVCWSPFVPFDQVAALVASRSFPLTSSFRPNYNMAANLMSRYSREEAHEVLGQSFAQFQADRAMVGMQRRLHEDRRRLDALTARAACELGDVGEYRQLLEAARRAQTRRKESAAAVANATAMLRPGDLVDLPPAVAGGATTAAVVISVAHRGKGAVRVRAVDSAGAKHSFDASELDTPLHPAGNVDLPSPFAPEDPAFLLECAALVLTAPIVERVGRRRSAAPVGDVEHHLSALESHPVHSCPDRDVHIEALEESSKLQRDTDRLQRAVRRRRSLISARLDGVGDLLEHFECARGWELTPRGRRLSRIYHEGDLLVVLAIDEGLLDDLPPSHLAALVSAFTYEERGGGQSDRPRRDPASSGGVLSGRLRRLDQLAAGLRLAERERGLPQTRVPDAGFVPHVTAWAEGSTLFDALGEEISAGDFVRNVKLIVDLLDQISGACGRPQTARSSAAAARLLVRGVVAAGEAVQR